MDRNICNKPHADVYFGCVWYYLSFTHPSMHTKDMYALEITASCMWYEIDTLSQCVYVFVCVVYFSFAESLYTCVKRISSDLVGSERDKQHTDTIHTAAQAKSS
jgi:hypothetical protein